MQGHRENSKKVPAPSRVPLRVKSRDLSIPPGLDLHTPVGPELALLAVSCEIHNRVLRASRSSPLSGTSCERRGRLTSALTSPTQTTVGLGNVPPRSSAALCSSRTVDGSRHVCVSGASLNRFKMRGSEEIDSYAISFA